MVPTDPEALASQGWAKVHPGLPAELLAVLRDNVFQPYRAGSRCLLDLPAVREAALFNDPVALATEWTPLAPGGTNFRTHQLRRITGSRWEFRATTGSALFCAVFTAFGLGALGGSLFVEEKGRWVLTLLGIVFSGLGILLWYLWVVPRVFDKERDYYCKSRRKPERLFDPSVLKHYAPLKDIHALQIVSEHVKGDRTSYQSYELNLILENGSRLNVVDHGNSVALREDAAMLAGFLGVPLWDAG